MPQKGIRITFSGSDFFKAEYVELLSDKVLLLLYKTALMFNIND